MSITITRSPAFILVFSKVGVTRRSEMDRFPIDGHHIFFIFFIRLAQIRYPHLVTSLNKSFQSSNMSGLLFMSSEDFHIKKGTKGNIMCHNTPGFSLILFYSTNCGHCSQIVPVFKKLPGTVGGCQFGMVNVDRNRACVKMSQNTISPIEYVPLIILYVHTKPYMIYTGEANLNEIRSFVIDIAKNIQTKQKFSNERVKDDGKTLPVYTTIGTPIVGSCKDNVCYLEFDDAYQKPPSKNGGRDNYR